MPQSTKFVYKIILDSSAFTPRMTARLEDEPINQLNSVGWAYLPNKKFSKPINCSTYSLTPTLTLPVGEGTRSTLGVQLPISNGGADLRTDEG